MSPRVLALFLFAAIPALAAGPDRLPVPDSIQQLITDHFSQTFLLPNLVNWNFIEMHKYAVGGYAVCGTVNYPDSTRRYVGAAPFFSIIRNGEFQEGEVVTRNALQDPVQATRRAYAIACGH